MIHSRNPKNSEVDAYSYIKTELEKLGWVVKNPARVIEGEVYKQNEGLSNKDLKEVFVRDMPEATIKLNECDFWVVESKRDKKDINKAIEEAKQYANKVNKSKKIKCLIISGVAGNDTDGYSVVNQYLQNNKWETILFNGKSKDTLLSKQQAKYIINNKTINYKDFPDFPDEKYKSSAGKINEILHNAGINKNKRARFIAGLILSLTVNEIDLRTEKAKLLVDNINNLIKSKLEDVNKEDFYDFIKLEVPPSKENHIKYRQAIIDTLKELQTLDIKNAMASGRDILGNFYEKFLKYGNGAKEIGIVLTPRHITKFGVEVLDVKNNDYVLDPACGTGGFLVSAFDYVKRNSNAKQIEKFRNYNIFGIDQDDEVITLALVNMIFRGDGRNNMGPGNCFQKNLTKIQKKEFETGKYEPRKGNEENKNPIVTKVLMNPPFALKTGEEKEYKFVDYALSQMEGGGLLFVILPSPIMFKGRKVKDWRKEMLKNNTLKAVIKLPEDLFYPIGVVTSAVIIQKGIPHNFEKDVFWGRLDDGYVKKKGEMKKKSDGNIETIKSLVKDFLNGSTSIQKNVPKLYSIEPILNDKDLECAPEYFLKEAKHPEKEIINGMTHSCLSLLNHLINNTFFRGIKINLDNDGKIKNDDELIDVFDIENAKSKNIEDYGIGEMPFITSTTTNNGIEAYIDEDEEELIYRKPCITLSSFGQANVQINPFVARSHGAVLVLVPKKDMSLRQLLYYASQINIHNWRFSYGRWVTKKRLLKLEIENVNGMKLPLIQDIKKSFEESLKFIKQTF